jgi:ABC-type transporter Mla subunit MlaD
MSTLTSFADFTDAWGRLSTALAANSQDVPQLAAQHDQLKAALASATALASQRDTLRAELQQATKNLQAQLVLAKGAYTRIRHGLRQQYGPASDKLVEFGLKPLGRRRAKLKPTLPPTAPETTPTAPTSPSLE